MVDMEKPMSLRIYRYGWMDGWMDDRYVELRLITHPLMLEGRY